MVQPSAITARPDARPYNQTLIARHPDTDAVIGTCHFELLTPAAAIILAMAQTAMDGNLAHVSKGDLEFTAQWKFAPGHVHCIELIMTELMVSERHLWLCCVGRGLATKAVTRPIAVAPLVRHFDLSVPTDWSSRIWPEAHYLSKARASSQDQLAPKIPINQSPLASVVSGARFDRTQR